MSASDDKGTRRTKASVQDAIGKLIGDDTACAQPRRAAEPPAAPDPPPAKE